MRIAFAPAYALAIVLLAAGGALAAPQAQHPAETTEARPMPTPRPELRPGATVTDDVVRLGDIFENVGEKADIPVAYAPRPGRHGVFDAQRLRDIARAHRLAWRPRGRFERIVVGRASQLIQQDAIVAEVRAALDERGIEGEYRVALDRRNMTVHLPTDVTPTLALQDFRYDERTRRFSATLQAPADAPAVRTPLTGKVERVAEVPVLRLGLGRNAVIAEDNVEVVRLRAADVRRDTILDPQELIGMATRRHLRGGTPVRRDDVREPVLIPKGTTVTMVYRTDTMTLTTRGRALADGSKGAAITIMNAHSKKTVEAVVVDAETVVVEANRPLVLNR